ncbi:MAG: hypothetical protein ACSHX8_16160, partial [Opitutaceae bacterium]
SVQIIPKKVEYSLEGRVSHVRRPLRSIRIVAGASMRSIERVASLKAKRRGSRVCKLALFFS